MKYYCIGIKGTGMSTLAQILSDLGNTVSGYDDAKEHKFTQDGLDERNIPIYYDNTHEIDKDTIVTYSVAFKEDHKEIKRVRSLGLKVKKYNEIVGDIINMFESIGVSGTHGKTTTSSLIRHLLEHTIGCNYFIGAGDGHVTNKNKYFVVESDEFNKHFTAYHPAYSVITNIEAEHLECYDGIDDIRNTFEIFANQTKKLIIANGDNQEVRKISYQTPVKFYGFDENNDIVIKNIDLTEEGSAFDLYEKNQKIGHFTINLYGKHMVMDATAAIQIAREIGLDVETIANLLPTFKNAKRRFSEQKVGKTTIIDDYAHHPTEIKATLEAVRQKYPNKKLNVIFAPNTYSRTKDFKNEFIDSLKVADNVYLTEIRCNREKAEDYPGITSSTITDNLPNGQIISEKDMYKVPSGEDQIVCFMGCAYVDDLINAYKEANK